MPSYSEKMAARLDYGWAAPDALKAMLGLESYLKSTSLEPGLRELVKLRASQINGCAYCVDLHAREARQRGESERRLHAVAVWRESPLFTPQERAALDWTEAVTLLADNHIPDDLFENVSEHFQGKDLADLTLAIVAINGWNRLAVAFRQQPPMAG